MKLSAPLDADQNELRRVRTENLTAAPSTPVIGQRYFDTVTKTERVWDGTKWTDLTDVWVGPGAPSGTPAVGDLWYDTDDAAPIPPGTELAYNQITASVTITQTLAAAANLIIEGTTRTYDGSPVIVEFYATAVQAPNVAAHATSIALWDGSTDLGGIGEVYNAPSCATTVYGRRRITPTAGTHNFRIAGYMSGGAGGVVYAAPGGAGSFQGPAYIRVIRA